MAEPTASSNSISGEARQCAAEADATRPVGEATEPESPVPAAERASGRSREKANWAAIGGIALFAAVVVLLLVSGLLRAFSDSQESMGNDIGVGASAQPARNTSAPVPSPAPVQELAQWQRELLDALFEKLPEALASTAKGIVDDRLFLAAVGKASYKNPVFDDYGVTIALLLPDPRKASLDKLGIERYAPHSGARAYINENYATLCRMDTPDRIEYPVTLFYQSGAGGEKTLDWTLQPIYWPLYEYSRAFAPHVERFMADMGFHDAAKEILMPDFQSWESHAGADRDAAFLKEYFSDLAAALELQGIHVYDKVLVDKEQIQRILEKRLAEAWFFDSLSIAEEYGRPHLNMRIAISGNFFWRVYEELDAKFRSGQLARPSSLEALEDVYLAAARELANKTAGDFAANEPHLVVTKSYAFDWERLGSEGISACPDLVEELRSFLYSYDFSLMFLD